jgi:hypothetical protein
MTPVAPPVVPLFHSTLPRENFFPLVMQIFVFCVERQSELDCARSSFLKFKQLANRKQNPSVDADFTQQHHVG